MIKRRLLSIGILCFLCLIALASVFWSTNKLTRYNNMIEFLFEDPVENPREKVEFFKIREMVSSVVITRYADIFAGKDGRSDKIALYVCDTNMGNLTDMLAINLKYRDGSLTEPIDKNVKQAIIDEDLAVSLFSYADCTGREITISGQTYLVSGVVGRVNSFELLWASTERYAVYVNGYDMPNDGRFSRMSYIIKCTENASGLALSEISNMLTSSNIYAKAAVNIDTTARFGIFAAKFMILVTILLLLFIFAKRILQYLRRHKKSDECFNEKSTLIIFIFMVLVLFAFAIWLFGGLHLTIDPRMIPSTLADPNIVLGKLRDYIIEANNGYISGGKLYPIVHAYELLTISCSVITAISGWEIVLIANKLLSTGGNHKTKRVRSNTAPPC